MQDRRPPKRRIEDPADLGDRDLYDEYAPVGPSPARQAMLRAIVWIVVAAFAVPLVLGALVAVMS